MNSSEGRAEEACFFGSALIQSRPVFFDPLLIVYDLPKRLTESNPADGAGRRVQEQRNEKAADSEKSA